MRIILTALLALTLQAQVAEKTIPLPDKIAAGGAPPAKQFTHEQKDALKDAAIQALVSERQVASAQKAADAANTNYVTMLNKMLEGIGCVGGQVDLAFNVSCPPK